MKTDAVQETAIPRTLDEVVAALGWAYGAWKEYEGSKNQYRDEFFQLADEALKREGLSSKLFEVAAQSETQAYQRAELHNPGWLVDELRAHPDRDGTYEVILAEDPKLKPFVHEHYGTRYARTVSKGPVMIDDDWLMEADPELYEAVTHALPWGDRISIPVEHLPAPLLGALSEYIYNGKPRVALSAPRAVKDES